MRKIWLKLKKCKKYFYSHQLNQSMTSWFDRNSTFYCFALQHPQVFWFSTLFCCTQNNTMHVEFMSNHNVIFWVNWCKNKNNLYTSKIMVPCTRLSWVSAERSWEGVPTCTGPSTFHSWQPSHFQMPNCTQVP